MAEIADLKKSLPARENSFSIIALEGSLTKEIFEGNFTCKILNMKGQALVAKHRAMLNGGLEDGLDANTKKLHHMLAYLKYALTDSPKWWKDADFGYDLFDANVVVTLYDKVLAYEDVWLESIWGPEKKTDGNSKEA